MSPEKRTTGEGTGIGGARSRPGRGAEPPEGGITSKAEREEALRKLNGLLDSGVLTREQFESERRKLLGRE